MATYTIDSYVDNGNSITVYFNDGTNDRTGTLYIDSPNVSISPDAIETDSTTRINRTSVIRKGKYYTGLTLYAKTVDITGAEVDTFASGITETDVLGQYQIKYYAPEGFCGFLNVYDDATDDVIYTEALNVPVSAQSTGDLTQIAADVSSISSVVSDDVYGNEALATLIDAIANNPGANSVTLTITNATTSSTLEGAFVRYALAGSTVNTGLSNSSGVYATGLDSGTYIRTISKYGFTPAVATVTISGETTASATLSPITSSSGSGAVVPGQAN